MLLPTTLLLRFLTAFILGFVISQHSLAQNKVPDSNETFVDLGYHKLFITQTGSPNARFTVVFESGAGGSSIDWLKVKALLPSNIRTVAYDRAGAGKSDAGPLPRTMAQEVFELNRLLNLVQVKGPIILVGQSLGGLLVRQYSEQFGRNVVGIVLVDPTHESSILGSMRYGGMVRLREKATGKAIPKPQLKEKVSPGYDSTADYLAEEFQKIYLSSETKPRRLNNLPLIILAAGKGRQPPGTTDEQWKTMRAERLKQLQDLTILSGNSKFILVTESGHMMHYDNPGIVAKAIEMIIESITSKSKL